MVSMSAPAHADQFQQFGERHGPAAVTTLVVEEATQHGGRELDVVQQVVADVDAVEVRPGIEG